MKTAPKYTAQMEQRIRETSPLNQATTDALAAEFGLTGASVRAKISRMAGVKYERKIATTKTGAPVEHKDAIVAQLAELVGANLDGLDKAPKPALQALRDFLTA